MKRPKGELTQLLLTDEWLYKLDGLSPWIWAILGFPQGFVKEVRRARARMENRK